MSNDFDVTKQKMKTTSYISKAKRFIEAKGQYKSYRSFFLNGSRHKNNYSYIPMKKILLFSMGKLNWLIKKQSEKMFLKRKREKGCNF
jgi:hypothetical protein